MKGKERGKERGGEGRTTRMSEKFECSEGRFITIKYLGISQLEKTQKKCGN